MADRFEQWSRARLGNHFVDDKGEHWMTVVVPVDGIESDPRTDVLAALAPPQHVPDDVHIIVTEEDAAAASRMADGDMSPIAEKPPTTRHRKTRGK